MWIIPRITGIRSMNGWMTGNRATKKRKKEWHLLIIITERISRLCAVMLAVITYVQSEGRRENCSTNTGSSWLINVDFVHSLWLLVPPPQQVHLSPGLRANTSGEGGVLSALHLVTTERWDAVHFNNSLPLNFIQNVQCQLKYGNYWDTVAVF